MGLLVLSALIVICIIVYILFISVSYDRKMHGVQKGNEDWVYLRDERWKKLRTAGLAVAVIVILWTLFAMLTGGIHCNVQTQ